MSTGGGDAGGETPEQEDELRDDLRALSARVGAVESAVRLLLERSRLPDRAPGAGNQTPTAARAESAGTHTLQQGGLAAAPAFTAAPQPASLKDGGQKADPERTLESRMGSFFLNRIGVIAVIIGVGLFLKLGVDRKWFTPPLQIAAGLALAIGLVLWSERFRRRGFSAFSFSLKALGASIAYLTLWAAFDVYALISAGTAFAAMVVVTAAIAVLAWLQDSELLALYALLGGLATPALVSTGQNHELFLFSYLLLLDVCAVVLSGLRPWSRLILGSFAGTVVYFGLWWAAYYSVDAFALTGTFLLLFFLLFTAAPVLALHLAGRRSAAVAGSPGGTSAANSAETAPMERAFGDFMAVGLPLLVHGFAFAAGWWWAGDRHHGFRPWIALGMAVASLGVDLAVRGVPDAGRKAADRFADVHFGLAIFFVALGAWLEFHAYGVTLCWLAEALVLGALITLGHPHHHHPATEPGHVTTPRTYATLMLAAACVDLVILEWIDAPWGGESPVLNVHFAVYLAGLGVFAAVAWLCGRSIEAYRYATGAAASPGLRSYSVGMSVEPGSLTFLAGSAVVAFNVVALVAGCVQIHLYWLSDELQQYQVHQRAAGPHTIGFSYSVWFMIYGALLMAAGFLRRSAFLRWQALALLAFSIGKVFVVDASRLSQGYRVMSFLGLGALLLTISFAYQRDWLALRGPE